MQNIESIEGKVINFTLNEINKMPIVKCYIENNPDKKYTSNFTNKEINK